VDRLLDLRSLEYARGKPLTHAYVPLSPNSITWYQR